jgi:ABC-type transport system involved in cytochrome bd biosynthesis fused ATPase/permease subunit
VKPLASSQVPSSAAGRTDLTEHPVLILDGVMRAYGARTVVAIPSWAVAAGQHSLILGPSGSGKTTLLHLIAGLLRPSRGSVRVAGQDLGALTPAQLDAWRGKMIGIVLQRLHLIPALTVRDNLRLARTLARLPPIRRGLILCSRTSVSPPWPERGRAGSARARRSGSRSGEPSSIILR